MIIRKNVIFISIAVVLTGVICKWLFISEKYNCHESEVIGYISSKETIGSNLNKLDEFLEGKNYRHTKYDGYTVYYCSKSMVVNLQFSFAVVDENGVINKIQFRDQGLIKLNPANSKMLGQK